MKKPLLKNWILSYPKEMTEYEHFKGKDALGHVVETQAKALIAGAEIHGVEIPGHLSAGADAARETAVLLALLWALLSHLHAQTAWLLTSAAIFTLGWLIWKTGRAAWLSWSRLERLHRIIAEERWEIEHHRPQEREELKELYASKGFQGKLLEDVLDVLMADNDRLLRVMLEEELGLSLHVHEHPLKQALGAALGVLIAGLIALLAIRLSPSYGIFFSMAFVVAAAAGLSAFFEKNRLIPAMTWALGIALLSFGTVYWLLDFTVSL